MIDLQQARTLGKEACRQDRDHDDAHDGEEWVQVWPRLTKGDLDVHAKKTGEQTRIESATIPSPCNASREREIHVTYFMGTNMVAMNVILPRTELSRLLDSIEWIDNCAR